MKQIIIDTDIGFDLDDTWAILFAINCPEFDVKLISVSDGDIDYKFRLTAKLLQLCRRTDIPIALGKSHGEKLYPQKPYVEDFDPATYEGKVYATYQEAYGEVLKEGAIDIVALSSMTSLQDVVPLLREKGCSIYSMMGSIRKGHAGSNIPIAEYNVVNNVSAAQAVFNGVEKLVMFPLDCCGQNVMRGENYRRVYESASPICRSVMENYKLWYAFYPYAKEQFVFEQSSGVLFDLAPLWYLLWPEFYVMETLNVTVDDEGYTRVGQKGKRTEVATEVLRLEELMRRTVAVLCKE